MKMLKDVFHDHTLELIPLDRKADIRSCVACTQGIIDNNYYNCPVVGCNYFLHEFCGELPLEIKHGLHQEHELRLETNTKTICNACWKSRGVDSWCTTVGCDYFLQRFYEAMPETKSEKCDACGEMSKGYFYACRKCKFYLDLVCATPAERLLEHHGHAHPLTLIKREMETHCNCCGKKHQGIFYHCQKCVIFYIHQDCASHGPVVDAIKHPHPLRFVYTAIRTTLSKRIYKDTKYDEVHCQICHKTVSRGSWYLECVPCDFQSHVNCAMYEGENYLVPVIGHEIPRLPWEDSDEEFGVVGLLNRKFEANDEVEKEQMKINHFSHPEHELILHAEVMKVEDSYHGHQIHVSSKCNGCTRKISSPFYSCLDCDFFLHKCCALLPSSIPQHPLFHQEHQHLNLVQQKKPWRVEELFFCDCCKQLCNGFYFQCQEEHCLYTVDVECAFLPTSIVHKSHPHLLTLNKYPSYYRSDGCCEGTYPRWRARAGYECRECDFSIHMECAMYPGRASHRYDHENPFKLWYDRGAVEANYFYCERCEQFMDPKEWYYHSKSSIGDQLLHPECFLQREYHQMFKFKSTKNFLQVDFHPHRLHLSPLNVINKYCGYCGKSITKISGYDTSNKNFIGSDENSTLSYKCWEVDCDFILHHSCSMKLRGTYSTVVEYSDESS